MSTGPDKVRGHRRTPRSRIPRDTRRKCSRASILPRRPDRHTTRSRKGRCGERQSRRDKGRLGRPVRPQNSRGPGMCRWASRAGYGSVAQRCSLHQKGRQVGRLGFAKARPGRKARLPSPGSRTLPPLGNHSAGTGRCTCHPGARWCTGWRPSRDRKDSQRIAGRPGTAHPCGWPARR